MKTHHFQIAIFLLFAFLQIFPVQAQRSSGSRGRDWANLPHGYNIMWDFVDGVLRVWAKEDFKNPWTYATSVWSDCIMDYKAYVSASYSWTDLSSESDTWYNFNDIDPNAPAFTETPWYPIREHIRQVQIDGSIYYIGSFALTNFTKCRSIILHDGVEKLCAGAITQINQLKHIYLPSSLEQIKQLCFKKSPDRKPLELVCNMPEPVKIVQTYYIYAYLLMLRKFILHRANSIRFFFA